MRPGRRKRYQVNVLKIFIWQTRRLLGGELLYKRKIWRQPAFLDA
jgi:hypothetical protein